MKQIILYTSKKGCTQKCATYLASKHQIDTVIRVTEFTGTLEEYDHVILMTPVYIGQIQKEIKEFIRNNNAVLITKNLDIVVIGMNVKEYDNMIKLNFSKEILEHATLTYGGGAYYFEKLNFFQKVIVKKITGVQSTIEDIKYQNLEKIKI